QIDLGLIGPVKGWGELTRQVSDFVGSDHRQIEVYVVKSVCCEILCSAIRIEHTTTNDEPFRWNPHAQGGPCGGMVKLCGDWVLIESEVCKVILVTIPE